MTPTAPTSVPAAAGLPPFTGRARWLAASLFLTGTVLQAVEFLLENPVEDQGDRVAYWLDNSTRVEWAAATGLLAVPFLLGGFGVLVALSRPFSPRLAWTAAVLLTCAMVGLAAIHGLELGAYWLARAGRTEAAVTILEGEDPALPGAVLFVLFLGGAVFGVLTIVAATWRSLRVPRAVPVVILAFAVLDFGLGFGRVAHVVNVAGGLLLAWAVVTGYTRASGHGDGEGRRPSLPRPRKDRGSHRTSSV